MKRKAPKGFATLRELSEATGVSKRQLLRWRAKGVFRPAKIRSTQEVFYARDDTILAIRKYKELSIARYPSRYTHVEATPA